MSWTLFSMVLSIVVIGGLLAATPWLMPPTECFTITVPPSAQHDARIVNLKRLYALCVAGVSIACALGLARALTTVENGSPTEAQLVFLSVVITVTTLIPIVASFILMLHARSRVKALKEQEGWTAQTHRSAALIVDDFPGPLPLAWNLLYIPLVLGMVVFALLSYDRFPDQIPMNADFSGNVNNYVDKSLGSVLFPAMFAAFMGLVFTFTHWMSTISKKPVDPAAPATSALAYGRFARLQSLLMLIGGLTLSATVGITFYLSALQVLSLEVSAAIITVVALIWVGIVIVFSALTGQAGGRLAAQLRTTDEVAADDDEHWVLGAFYFNPQDPSLIVPKRFGIGWTINHAHPIAWLTIGALIAFTIGFSILITWAVA